MKHRLIRTHQQVERPDLTAVGVPRDLQVNPGPYSLTDLLRLVRQQQYGQGRVGPGERGVHVGAVAGPAGVAGGDVVDPGQDDPVLATADHEVPVVQRL